MKRTFLFLGIFILDVSVLLCTKSVMSDNVPSKSSEAKKIALFDGKSLDDWTVPVYGGDGEVIVKEGNLVIGQGAMMTGIRYDKEFPRINYEISFQAKRTRGYDFFAALTFPVGDAFCTFVNGGWGGGTIGLSCVDGYDASENPTSSFYSFKDDQWYQFRLNVSDDNISVWIAEEDKDGAWKEKKVVDLDTKDVKLSLRNETNMYKPLGFSTWASEGTLRKMEYHHINPKKENQKEKKAK
ncbi:MAG: 3-keto-disaccharide hydrolase [Thermoguttaceae bacterium]